MTDRSELRIKVIDAMSQGHFIHEDQIRAVEDLILAYTAERVAEAEDKTLEFALKLFELTGHWPEYYKRQLKGDRYRKAYKNTKVGLRALLKATDYERTSAATKEDV